MPSGLSKRWLAPQGPPLLNAHQVAEPLSPCPGLPPGSPPLVEGDKGMCGHECLSAPHPVLNPQLSLSSSKSPT